MKKTTIKSLTISAAILSAFATQQVLADEMSLNNPNLSPSAPEIVSEGNSATSEKNASETILEAKNEVQEIVSGPQAGQTSSLEITNTDVTTYTDGEVTTWENLEVKTEFEISGDVAEGDSYDIQAPEALKFTYDQDAELDLNTPDGVNFAKATYASSKNSVNVTLTAGAVGMQNIKGGLKWNMSLNHEELNVGDNVPLTFTINNKVYVAGNLKYTGIGEYYAPAWEKSSWQTGDGSLLRTNITIGKKDGINPSGLNLLDVVPFASQDNVDFLNESLRIYVGKWIHDDKYGWELKGDVTRLQPEQVNFAYNSQKESWTMTLPELPDGSGVQIYYNSKITAGVNDGETLDNTVTITTKDGKTETKTANAVIRNLSGWIVGDKKPVETKIPEDFPTYDLPEIETKQEIPNTAPSYDLPEIKVEYKIPEDFPTTSKPEADISIIPGDFPSYDLPTLELPEQPKPIEPTPAPEADKPEINVPIVPTGNRPETIPVVYHTTSQELPATGTLTEEQQLLAIVAGISVILGVGLTYAAGKGKKN